MKKRLALVSLNKNELDFIFLPSPIIQMHLLRDKGYGEHTVSGLILSMPLSKNN